MSGLRGVSGRRLFAHPARFASPEKDNVDDKTPAEHQTPDPHRKRVGGGVLRAEARPHDGAGPEDHQQEAEKLFPSVRPPHPPPCFLRNRLICHRRSRLSAGESGVKRAWSDLAHAGRAAGWG